MTKKRADGKVDKAKAESSACINQRLRAHVWAETTPAGGRALWGFTPPSSKGGFGTEASASGTGGSIAVVLQSSIRALKPIWDAKKKKKKI